MEGPLPLASFIGPENRLSSIGDLNILLLLISSIGGLDPPTQAFNLSDLP
jgi:hypothetical protein